MMTSPTTLSWQRVLQRVKLAVASMQRALSEGNSFAFRNRKSESVGDWCNGKSMRSVYFRYDSDISKCKWSLFAQYCTTLTLLASNSLERYVDVNTASDVTVPWQLSSVKFRPISYHIKIVLATGRLINIDRLALDEAN